MGFRYTVKQSYLIFLYHTLATENNTKYIKFLFLLTLITSLNDLKEKYGDRLIPIELDVTNDESIAKAASLANDTEILVNNAGVSSKGNFLGGNLMESFKTNLDVNFWGLVKVTNAFLKTITKNDSGAIVSISSVAGLANAPMTLTYSVSKAAIHSLIQGLRGELKESNILISGVYPGPIDTDMAEGIPMAKESPENVAKEILLGLAEGVEDIYPDPISKQIGQGYASSPKMIEE